jgi:PAS domain-containing protein
MRQEVREFMTALLAGSGAVVRQHVAEAFRRSGSLLYVMTHLVDAARLEVEDMWYRGQLSVIDEQRMLGQLDAVVLELSRGLPRPPPPSRRCVLTAADQVAGDLTQRLLEEDGWSVRRFEMSDVVDQARLMPGVARRLIVMVGDTSVASAAARSIVANLNRLGSRVLVAVPGQWAQAGRWHRLGAEACVGDARTLLLLARKLHAAGEDFSISEVAASLGVTPHTIRAWERRYRIPQASRDRSGQRRYSAEDVELLLRISHGATVHGHSLRLASLEAQGLVTDEAMWVDSAGGAPPSVTPGSEQDWRRIADAVPQLLVLVDQQGVIVDCNMAMARLRNTVRERLRGTPLTDLVIEYDRAKAVRLYRPAPVQREAWELRLPSSNDDQVVVAFDSRIVSAESGRLVGLIGTVVSQGGSDSPGPLPLPNGFGDGDGGSDLPAA